MAMFHSILRASAVAKRSSETSINIVLSFCSCSLICGNAMYRSLRYKMRSYLSYGGFKKRNKNSSCIRLPVKVHFWTRIYSTCQQKLILYISHLCKKVNRIYKKQPQMRLFQNDFRGYMTNSHKKECGSTHHISRGVSLLFLCSPEDFALLAPAQRLLRLAGREVSQLLHQWQSRVISDLLSGYSRGLISSPRQTRLLDEENSPVLSY